MVAKGRKELIFYLLMKIKILNWNVKGLNAKEKRVVVKSLLKGWKADVVCLQETKLNEMSMMIVKELWGSHWVNWIHLDAIGVAGGCW